MGLKIKKDGTRYWHKNGVKHREDGPAVEYADGSKEWFLNNELHRENGPAVENSNGYKAWYLEGVAYTEDEFNKEVLKWV